MTPVLHSSWHLQSYTYPELAQFARVSVGTVQNWVWQDRKRGVPVAVWYQQRKNRAFLTAAESIALLQRHRRISTQGFTRFVAGTVRAPERPKWRQDGRRASPSAPLGPTATEFPPSPPPMGASGTTLTPGPVSGKNTARRRKSPARGDANR